MSKNSLKRNGLSPIGLLIVIVTILVVGCSPEPMAYAPVPAVSQISIVENGIQKEIGTVKLGSVGVTAPKRMRMGDSQEISLTIFDGNDAYNFEQANATKGDVGRLVQVYPVMTGEIKAATFEIGESKIERELSPTSPTKFMWVITPKAVGNQTLIVELTTSVNVSGYEKSVTRGVYSKPIQIVVDKPFKLVDFLKDYVAIIGGLVAIIGGVIGWKIWKRPKKTGTIRHKDGKDVRSDAKLGTVKKLHEK
ncbi:MAG: hypothetical protein Q7J73_07050 [Dehalococcoidales bacterium]|nr:hypothetical protein [Dehalococcoidales bacterium]